MRGLFEIDPLDHEEDKRLLWYCTYATDLIEEFLGNRDFSLKFRTIVYPGTGTVNLVLRHRPVYPAVGTANALTVTIDSNAYYGSAAGAFSGPTSQPLVYGTDYCLQVDQDDGSSKCAILLRINDVWPKPNSRQGGWLTPFISKDFGSVQVQYLAGYTVDTLPGAFRLAADALVAKLRFFFPLGLEVSGDNYEDRSINLLAEKKDYLMGLIKPLLWNYRTWRFG